MDLAGIRARALATLATVESVNHLEEFRVTVLGKKGELGVALRGLGGLPPEERRAAGAALNEVREAIEGAWTQRRELLARRELEAQLSRDRIDTSLKAWVEPMGALHPITQTLRRLVEVGARIGFEVSSGPEVELDYFNFEAVNIPADHPARDMQDTFFIEPGVVLRTHTTPVQMRTLQERGWPVRILCPGAVYRCDDDATHSPMFHQMEGLWVDRGVRFSDLKGVLEWMMQELFGSSTQIRFRPSYFSFVEPGVEVDVSCFQCKKSPQLQCRVCKGTGWLEVMGAGMVHPELYRHAGISVESELSGFAFGMGIERMAMLLHEISDLRLFFQNDFRFLRQFT